MVTDDRRCTAKTSSSNYERRCRRAAIKGGTVCYMHGGAAGQVKRTAKQRLLEAAEPAVVRLVRALEDESSAVAVKAAQLVLDRAGLHPSQAVELTGADGGPVQHQDVLPLELLSVQTRRMIIEDLRKAKGGDGPPASSPATGAGPSAGAGVNPPGDGKGPSSPPSPGGRGTPPHVVGQPIPTTSPFTVPSTEPDEMIL